jgi:DNA invertase Pin-like site-specific DNA recombinase
MISGMFSYFN